MIKAIFIDIDDTILDFSQCAKYAMEQSFKEFNLNFEDYMFPVFIETNNEYWQMLERKEITKDELYGHRWFTIFKKIGIENIDCFEFEEHFRFYIENSFQKVENAEEILLYLASKYKIFAVSNGPHSQQLNRLKNAELFCYFTDVFTSELIGFEKPNKEFFDACFSKIHNISPSETVLIGDSLTADILGGVNYNIPTIWLNSKNKNMREDITPTHIVKTLLDIKNYI